MGSIIHYKMLYIYIYQGTRIPNWSLSLIRCHSSLVCGSGTCHGSGAFMLGARGASEGKKKTLRIRWDVYRWPTPSWTSWGLAFWCDILFLIQKYMLRRGVTGCWEVFWELSNFGTWFFLAYLFRNFYGWMLGLDVFDMWLVEGGGVNLPPFITRPITLLRGLPDRICGENNPGWSAMNGHGWKGSFQKGTKFLTVGKWKPRIRPSWGPILQVWEKKR